MPQLKLLVPVRRNPEGFAVRMFRTPLGARTAVAFTTETALIRALGPEQPWLLLGERAVRALGDGQLTIDPLLTARRPRREPELDLVVTVQPPAVAC